jgi:hypothetical protein
VVFRLFVLLIAMLIVAAPVDSLRAETCGDGAAELAACDDALTCVGLVITPEPEAAILPTYVREHVVPPAPALARVFRPPRHAIA